MLTFDYKAYRGEFRVPFLKVTKLSASYRNLSVFSDFSFEIEKGICVHLKGPNGSGKTTLLNTIAGLREPDRGNIEFLNNCRWDFLQAESNGHFLELGPIANLKFWLSLRGQTNFFEQTIFEELKAWGFTEKILSLNLKTAFYSTGMKRKLALIRLKLANSHLWLLDEPILGLDDASVEMFSKSLSQHLSNGGACLLASHDVSAFRNQIGKEISLS